MTSGTSTSTWTLSVDFGTTSTVAALTFADGRTEVLEVDGERRTPSVVLVDDDGSLVVGAAAVGLASSRPERTIRAPKRRLGEQTPVVLGGKPFNPVDLVASVLAYVMAEARRHVGSEPTSIRLTHPATWSRPLQQRLLEAAAKAGMPNADLVPEPVAAAMAAVDRNLPTGSYVAVYDLGGGTFDTTVVQSTDNGYVVVGHPIGDRQIGGELFDEALMNHVGSRLDPTIWEKIQVSDERDWHQAATRLLGECRRVKEALSSHGYGEIAVNTPGGMIDERITRDELEAIVAPYLDASVDLLERCVDDVGIEPSQLSAIHMIGGASRMPLAATMVEEAFPGVEVSRRGDPRTAVAMGAALVDLSAMQADVIADHNTTVEKRQRSIDAEAAAIDAAKANPPRAITPPTNPSILASPPAATPPPAAPTALPPTAPGTIAEPAAAAAPTYAAAHAPQQPVGPAPQQQPAQPQFIDPPPQSPPADSKSPPIPMLIGAGVLVLIAAAGLAFALTRGGDDGQTIASPIKATTAPATTASGGGNTLATLPDDVVTTTTATIPTTTASTEPPSSTTLAPAGGPTRDDAVALLFDLEEIPGSGWVNDTYDPEPLAPCGLVQPHQPIFSEGRAFIKNQGQVDVASFAHEVFVYANDAEAAAVMEQGQTLSDACPTAVVTVLDTDFNAFFQTCDLFETCDFEFPQSALNLLGGDEYAIQIALLDDPNSDFYLTDQVYAMRIGRSIVSVEYVVADIATEAETDDAILIALQAWGAAATFPR